MVIIMILSTINITAICTFCFKGINALNAYHAKMWTFLLHQNRFADYFCFISCLVETLSPTSKNECWNIYKTTGQILSKFEVHSRWSCKCPIDIDSMGRVVCTYIIVGQFVFKTRLAVNHLG